MIYAVKKFGIPLYYDANRCLSVISSIGPPSLKGFVKFDSDANQLIFSPNNIFQIGTYQVYLTIQNYLGLLKYDSFYLTVYETPQIGKFKE